MALDRRRFGRQIRLAEIGEAGQERLVATPVALSSHGFARTIEERYLRAAGAPIVSEPIEGGNVAAGGADEITRVLASLGIANDAARDVAEGALRALVVMRRVLALPTGGETS